MLRRGRLGCMRRTMRAAGMTLSRHHDPQLLPLALREATSMMP